MSDSSLATVVQARGHSTALIIPGKEPWSASFHNLHESILSAQSILTQHGVGPASVISTTLSNSLEFVVLFFAITGLGAVVAPLNPAYRREELLFYLEDTQSSCIVVPRGSLARSSAATKAASGLGVGIIECFVDEKKQMVLECKTPLRSSEENGDGQTASNLESALALILHTSGTTGKPKAVPLTHRNLLVSARNIVQTYQLSDRDCSILIMPLHHIHGLVAGLIAPLVAGSSVVISSSVSSTFWDLAQEHSVTWFTGTPTMHNLVLQHPKPEQFSNLRFVRSCSSSLSPAAFHRFEDYYGCPVLEAYAMTEAAHQIASNMLPPGKRSPGRVGMPMNVDLCVVGESGEHLGIGERGEICIKGANITSGYLRNDGANATVFIASGHFRTGDQGMVLEDGSVQLTGRLKELINKGGEKISPIELDSLISQHPAILEAVAFAISDDLYGEDIGLAVTLKKDAELTAMELKRWIGQRAALFKVPKQVRVRRIVNTWHTD